MKKRQFITFLTIALLLMLIVSSAACSSAPDSNKPIKIGMIRHFTGGSVITGEELQRAVEFALENANYEVNGRPIELISEDESDDPETAVAKAKKLIEQDKVDVILGPLLAHSVLAVEAYVKTTGVPMIPFGPADVAVSEYAYWWYATGMSGAEPGGIYAAKELGAKKVTFIYTDYLFSQQLRDGFLAGFEANGGSLVKNIPIPWNVTDLAPYLSEIGDCDILAAFVVYPSDGALIKQYNEYGIDVPLFFTSSLMDPDGALPFIGDDALGMYGTTFYTNEIDTPENKEFVSQWLARYDRYPEFAAIQGLVPALWYLEGLEKTKGDPDHAKMIEALGQIKRIDSPSGPININDVGTASQNYYIMQVGKSADDRYVWKVLATYEDVAPK